MKKQITKSYLEYLGVTDVTADGRVFTKKGELKPSLRGKSKNNPSKQEKFTIKLYDSEKYKAVPKEKRTDNSGRVQIYVHHVVYAWFHSEVPYSKEVHHIDGNCLNNAIDNLEALTPEEHRAKHLSTSTRELKCRLDIPREWYEMQIEKARAVENKTKVEYDRICNYSAKLRYYDSHIEEAEQLNMLKRDLIELKYWKKTFKNHGNKKLWHECCTIEKMVKEKGIEAMPAVKHALEVIYKTFGGE